MKDVLLDGGFALPHAKSIGHLLRTGPASYQPFSGVILTHLWRRF
jgi:hypothetical protein